MTEKIEKIPCPICGNTIDVINQDYPNITDTIYYCKNCKHNFVKCDKQYDFVAEINRSLFVFTERK